MRKKPPDFLENQAALFFQVIKVSGRIADVRCVEAQETQRFRAFQPPKSLPLGKFKYRAAYLQWFYKQNIRKYVNDLHLYLRLLQFLVSK